MLLVLGPGNAADAPKVHEHARIRGSAECHCALLDHDHHVSLWLASQLGNSLGEVTADLQLLLLCELQVSANLKARHKQVK